MPNRISLVTGASRGLGLEFVTQLSADPTILVFALARSPSTSTKLQSLASARQNVVVVKADTTNEAEMRAALKEVEQKIGGKGIDVLIANAGVVTGSGGEKKTLQDLFNEPFSTTPLSEFQQTFEVNVIGSMRTINLFLPLVKTGSEKKIIILSTGGASLTLNNLDNPFDPLKVGCLGGYSVSKVALNMAARKYAVELHKEGITVFAIQPAYTKTDLPGTDMATLEPPTVIEKVLKKIYSITLEDSGRFFDVAQDADVPF
ncbi:NAD(P)-binding protein [Atractiella rhizophila]|nr:NAD(P)-binding protein [Atractiella rhizophila]